LHDSGGRRDVYRIKAPVSRYINQYIEHATRRLFSDTYFNSWHIKAADDRNIERFCIVGASEVLAKGVRELNLYVDDDRMIAVRQGKLKAQHGSLSRKNITHVFDDVTGAMVPEAYFRRRHELVRALHACENLRRVFFHRYLEREQPHKQADGIEASDGETQPGHTSQARSENHDRDGHNEIGSDVEVIPDGNAFWATPQQRSFVVSTSSTYFLHLAEAAGVRLTSISTNRDLVGLTDFSGFARYKNVVQDMKELYLDVDYDRSTHEPVSRDPVKA
jgi:hypothetical protein